MLPKFIVRFVAFLVIPGFFSDPALAALLSQQPSYQGHNAVARSVFFESQAFSVRAVWERFPYLSSGVRDARHLGSDLETDHETLFAGESPSYKKNSLYPVLVKEFRLPYLNPQKRSKFENMSVDELAKSGLKTRSYNALVNRGIETIGQIMQMTEAELLRVKDYGQKGLTRTKEVIVQLMTFLPPGRLAPSKGQGPDSLSAVFTNPRAQELFFEEARTFGFDRFDIRRTDHPEQVSELVGVNLWKQKKPGSRWQVVPDELIIYEHFVTEFERVFAAEAIADEAVPQSRAVLASLLRIERARIVRINSDFYQSLDLRPPEQLDPTTKAHLAAQSYFEMSDLSANSNQRIADVARFIWFAHVIRSTDYHSADKSPEALKRVIARAVDEAFDANFPWLNPKYKEGIARNISRLDESINPQDIRIERDSLFAGQRARPTGKTDHKAMLAGQSSPATHIVFSHIRGVPAEGFAQTGINAEWNNVNKWINAVVSRNGTKLAVASRGTPSMNLSADDVGFIIEYDRDPKTGGLSHGEPVWRVHPHGAAERIGTTLYYTADHRLTFTSVLTLAGRAEIPNSEYTRDDFKGVYLLYQKSVATLAASWINPPSGLPKYEIHVTDAMIAYADIHVWQKNWVPRISPTNDRALMPVLRWKEPEKTTCKEFLIEVPIDLERGQWNAKDWRILLEGGEEIPGSLRQGLRLSKGGAQYNYSKNGNSILLAQDGHFYEIDSLQNSGQFSRGALSGKRLSNLFSGNSWRDSGRPRQAGRSKPDELGQVVVEPSILLGIVGLLGIPVLLQGFGAIAHPTLLKVLSLEALLSVIIVFTMRHFPDFRDPLKSPTPDLFIQREYAAAA